MKEFFSDRFALGIIDKDKKTVPYLDEFSVVATKANVKLFKHRDRHHFFIIISPAIEVFILKNAAAASISLQDFNLPDTLNELKRESKTVNSTKDARFKALFNALAAKDLVTGYDLATGWGSPNGMDLVDALAFRIADPIELSYYHSDANSCDFGPVAGNIAYYQVRVNTGNGPFMYHRTEVNAPFAGLATTSIVPVTVPPLGQSGLLTVTVTAAYGTSLTRTITVIGIDLVIAGKEIALCEHIKSMYQFIQPIYIDPGDPAKYRKIQQAFSPTELKTMNGLLNNMQKELNELGTSVHNR